MNEAEEEERCAKHKIVLNAICLTCNNMKCCYKCFTFSSPHFNHNSIFLNEDDLNNMEIVQEQLSGLHNDQNQLQNQLKEKKKILTTKQLISKTSQDNSSNLTNQIKSYRMQIDDLCKQITEQVWNYRQKFIQYMDSKLNEYNAFIQVEQGSQITSEIIMMRNELESFINSLKNQIKTIDSQNQQKDYEHQLQPCNCSQSIQMANNNYSQSTAFNHFNSSNANYISSDEDQSHFSQSSPSCYSISYSCSSSSASSPSPSSYSSSSPYYQNSYSTSKALNQYPNAPFNQKHTQRNNQYQSQQFIQKVSMNSQLYFGICEMQYQHLQTCPNYQLEKQFKENQIQMYSQAIQQKSIQNQIESKQLSQIFIILINGKSLPLQFNVQSSVLQIKILIFEKTGVPPLEQKLFYYTKELHNYTPMKEYQIPRDCSIKLYIRSFYQQLQSISKKLLNQTASAVSDFNDNPGLLNSQFSASFQINKQSKQNQYGIESQLNLNQHLIYLDSNFNDNLMIPDTSQQINNSKIMNFDQNTENNCWYQERNSINNNNFYQNKQNQQQNTFIYSS